MSRSAPTSPFKDNDEYEDISAIHQSASHSTSVLLPVKGSRQRVIESSSSSYSAPNSPSGSRRVVVCSPAFSQASNLLLNHPVLQRLREEEGLGNRNPDQNRRISCRVSLTQSSSSSPQQLLPSLRSSPILIQDFIATTSSPRSRSFSQPFANFSQSFPAFSNNPIRSSSISVSFTPGRRCIGPGSVFTVQRTRTDPGIVFKSASGNTSSRIITETIGNVIADMNYNRQQSAPTAPVTGRPQPPSQLVRPSDATGSRQQQRQVSFEVPQRPASASPTGGMQRMRLVPILQPVEANIDDDDDSYIRPSQQTSNAVVPVSRNNLPHHVFRSQASQPNYVQSLLEHQHKRLHLMEEQMNRMEYNVNVKRASIRLREHDLFKRLSLSAGSDVGTLTKIELLIKTLEDVRELEVSIIFYATEIDRHGSEYLNDLDLRNLFPTGRSPVTAIQAAADPPPIPPRPPVKSTAPGQKPSFGVLEMRVPTSVSCSQQGTSPAAGRKTSTGSNQTVTPNHDGFQRSTSQGYVSMLTPDADHALQQSRAAGGHGNEDEDDGDHWLCTSCTFKNHPDLNMCELCESPKEHYVPKSPSPIASPGFLK